MRRCCETSLIYRYQALLPDKITRSFGKLNSTTEALHKMFHTDIRSEYWAATTINAEVAITNYVSQVTY